MVTLRIAENRSLAAAKNGTRPAAKGKAPAEDPAPGLMRQCLISVQTLDAEGLKANLAEAGLVGFAGLALLVGPDQKWLTTEGFLDKVDENLKKAMA